MGGAASYTRNLQQVATYWEPGANDGFGGVTWAAPITIMCRWQDVASLVRDNEGQEVVSEATVYVDRRLLQKGYLALGDFTDMVDSDGFLDPTTVDDALQIITTSSSPSLSAALMLHKVML